MRKISFFISILCCCVGGIFLLLTNNNLSFNTNHVLESINISDEVLTDLSTTTDSNQYIKHINVPETDQMPNLYFELTGKIEKDNNYGEFYYPVKLSIKTEETIIQVLDFSEDNFVPCTLDDFGFEYGDYRFDRYGGFRILGSSMGKNPIYIYWVWDKNAKIFVEYQDLEMEGYTTFDYVNQVINVSTTGGNDYHEFMTYKYINGKLTLIEKAIDTNGYREIYKLKDGELELFEITESQMKG